MLSHTWLQAVCHLTGPVWATAAFLPLAFPQELQKHYASAFLLSEFPPLIVILQVNTWSAFVIYRNFISQRGF